MKTNIKNFIISFCIICSLLVTTDFLVGFIGDKMILALPDLSCQATIDNYKLNKVTSDIIIIGSSRARHHYVSSMLLDSICNFTHFDYSIYNAGYDGKFVNYNSCIAESLLNRYTPKIIIFEVSHFELTLEHEKTVSYMKSLAPYYFSNIIVKNYIDRLGWKEKIKVQSNMYRYNGRILNILKSLLLTTSDDTNLGYDPLFKKMTIIPPESENKDIESNLNQYSVTNFLRVLDYCQNNRINLVVVTSPSFRPNNNNVFIKQECISRGIPYINLEDIDYFNDNPMLFQDSRHLNDEGAHVFTNLFFEHLKPYLGHMLDYQNN